MKAEAARKTQNAERKTQNAERINDDAGEPGRVKVRMSECVGE